MPNRVILCEGQNCSFESKLNALYSCPDVDLYLVVQLQSAISPDASHIVSGSSDGNAYVWQVTVLNLSSPLLAPRWLNLEYDFN